MMQYQAPVYYKNPGLAAVLSFFWMGLGQIYNGQIAKGVLFMIAYGFSWLLMFLLIGFITTPVLFVIGIWDAYRSAEKINQRLAQMHAGQGVGQGPIAG
jgi:TM2 domain-containing membrane protein YozV